MHYNVDVLDSVSDDIAISQCTDAPIDPLDNTLKIICVSVSSGQNSNGPAFCDERFRDM